MKKILLAITVTLTTACVSFATLTVEEARSPKQLKKEGYSNVIIQTVQQESGEYNPTPTNRWQRFGFKVWNYIDPASPEARDKERHDIKWYSHYENL